MVMRLSWDGLGLGLGRGLCNMAGSPLRPRGTPGGAGRASVRSSFGWGEGVDGPWRPGGQEGGQVGWQSGHGQSQPSPVPSSYPSVLCCLPGGGSWWVRLAPPECVGVLTA